MVIALHSVCTQGLNCRGQENVIKRKQAGVCIETTPWTSCARVRACMNRSRYPESIELASCKALAKLFAALLAALLL